MRGINVCAILAALLTVQYGDRCAAQYAEPRQFILPESRAIEVRQPGQLPQVRFPQIHVPSTVSEEPQRDSIQYLPLDEAVRVALANAESIRILAGVTAVASGRTIYTPAIANTQIDDARGRFDPVFAINNNFNHLEQPAESYNKFWKRVNFADSGIDNYDLDLSLTKSFLTGATAHMAYDVSPTETAVGGLPLNPRTPSSLELGITQPLLRGAGVEANQAPIVIARIQAERSFFQTKSSLEEMVRGVIEAYWTLVESRTEVWASQQQVDQGHEACRRAEARLAAGFGDLSEVAQARSAAANFRAKLLDAKASVLERENGLRNILGLPPDGNGMVPSTPPSTERFQSDWQGILDLAGERRPDLIELKLVLQADEQQRLMANNNTRPDLNAVALYRWNGLSGVAPTGEVFATEPGQFTDWTLGIQFSVPVGLRSARAKLRQQDLILMQDRANIQQGLHSAAHELAGTYRRLAQYYEQYLVYRESRSASRLNLERQMADYRQGRGTLYLNVLQAITDWGNNVALEARAITQFNVELANLEQETGTILETHGVRFVEERYCAFRPLSSTGHLYPRDIRPTPNANRYPDSGKPAEDTFDLTQPIPGPAPSPPERVVTPEPER
jgi:outer membrane protein TolC